MTPDFKFLHFTTIVHGPQQVGKTKNAQRIADAYSMDGIVDDWHFGMPIERNKLHLSYVAVSHADCEAMCDFPLRVTNYEVAMEMVKIMEEGITT